ncbi:MAG TPA: Crp/Fnr family transcriptional regulator [Candidatus Dormibacteraeota bacterium]|nr:Crp/Fnr family transcriptional regulator [Candidatus Dormibacteraeota bacterium]
MRSPLVDAGAGSAMPDRLPADLGGEIRGLRLFAGVTDAHVARIAELFRARSFAGGERLGHAGPVPGVLLLLEGRLRITAVAVNGQEVTLRRYCAGSVAGLECLLPERERQTSTEIVAETDGRMAHAPVERIRDAMREVPSLAQALLTEAVRQLQDTEEFARRMAASTVVGRVAAALLELSLPAAGARVHREYLASRAAATRESVSRALTRLAGDGLIELHGTAVRVVGEAGLRRLATPGVQPPCYEAGCDGRRISICPDGQP